VPGGGAFLAPELRFHARVERPKAVDVWSLGAIVFAMLRMRRIVLDGSAMPRNGTESLRFAPTRAEQVTEVYRQGPARFFEQELDETAFPTPERLPEADRNAVRESLRGALGEEDPELEAKLTDAVLGVLDKALTIAPSRRYDSAGALAHALDELARTWIALAAEQDERSNPDAMPGPAVEAILRERDVARARAAAVQTELTSLQSRVESLHRDLEIAREVANRPVSPATVDDGPDRTVWILAGLGAVALLQLATVTGVVALLLLGALSA